MIDIEIVNIVATTDLGRELDLSSMVLALDAQYNPESFPGLIYRMEDPRVTFLFFRSGKVVCTGATVKKDVKAAVSKAVQNLEKAGFPVPNEPDINIQNIVATTDLDMNINLNRTAISLGLENVEYEPEQFPGLVYRVQDPDVVILLFQTGKLVCTGARKLADIQQGVRKFSRELKKVGQLY